MEDALNGFREKITRLKDLAEKEMGNAKKLVLRSLSNKLNRFEKKKI